MTSQAASNEMVQPDAPPMDVHGHRIAAGEIAIGVIIGRTSEFFDFFVYAIASVIVFPSLIFPNFEPLTATLYSFGLFALAFIARPIGTLGFMAIDRRHGRGVKLTIALFLLGGSTMSIALLPGYSQVGAASAWLLALARIGQGVALGGTWDGLPSLLALTAPPERRGWYAMIPQLGAPLGLLLAAGLFAYFLALLSPADFLEWGWRYPFFVVLAINVVALFARLRIVATPEFQRLFASRQLQPAPVGETLRLESRTICLAAFAGLASFALFHLVTVFPLSWVMLFTNEPPIRFLLIEMGGALLGVLSILASGVLADRVGRRAVVGIAAVLIGAFSGFAPQLLNAGSFGQAVYMAGGFVLLGLAFGQSAGIVNASFSPQRRYTGGAIADNLGWLIGAGFAPLVALILSSRFGLWSVGIYLLSGAVCTLVALGINKELGRETA